jgi:hypothetical protein
MLIGGTLLGNRLGWLDVNIFSYWPLLLVLVGGRIVLQAMSQAGNDRSSGVMAFPGGSQTPSGGDPGDVVSAVAVMSGFQRRITSQAFRGGELTAFMGGGKLDLRNALPANGEAVVNLFAMMGGFEIVIPESWSLVVEVTPFMGGIEDKARTSTQPSAPRLILRGFVMMSGIEIKNP